MVKHRARSEPSQRQLRVGELVRHALSDFLLRDEVRDEALSGIAITVAEVRASPDLRNATAYVLPLAGSNEEQVVQALNRHKKFIRGRITGQLRLKYIPEITFKADTTFAHSEQIDRLLAKTRQDNDTDQD